MTREAHRAIAHAEKTRLAPRRAPLRFSSAMFSIRCALFARSFAMNQGSTTLFSCRCALFCKHRGVGAPSFDFQLSTFDSSYSPLCFHNLTNRFSRNPFRLITFQIVGGCTPSAAALSEPLLELTPLTPIASVTTPRSSPAVADHSFTSSAVGAVRRASDQPD